MEIITIPSGQLDRRLKTIPVSNSLKSEVRGLFETWVTNSGYVWTVSRFKDWKAFILGVKSGMNPKKIKPSWFATTPYGNLSGVYHNLTTYAMSSDKNFKAVINLLGIYTSISYDKVPEVEVQLALNEIQQLPVSIPGWLEDHFRKGWGSPRSIRNGNEGDVIPLPKSGRPMFKIQSPNPLSVVPCSGVQGGKLLKDILDIQESSLTEHSGLRALLDEAAGIKFDSRSPMTSCTHDEVGDLWFKGEPGLKVRFYAAPNLVLQRVLEPLKNSLLEFAKSLPWDCTHHQRRADESISRALKSGKVVYSIDLKKATENFPWRLQRIVLRRLLVGSPKKWVKDKSIHKTVTTLLDFADPWKIITALPQLLGRDLNRAELIFFVMCYVVEKGQWRVQSPSGPKDRLVTWTKGQPLGTGPSFPLFSITHGLVIWFLNHMTWNHEFYVLGDDVVILDTSLGKRYMRIAERMGMTISKNKTYTSSQLAQFAGKTYTRESSTWFSPWRLVRKDNKLDLAAYWYPGLVDDKDKSLVNFVLSLPEPWGIGRNPNGLSLDDRMTPELMLELLGKEKSIPATGVATWYKLTSKGQDHEKYMALLRYQLTPWCLNSTRVKYPSLLPLMEETVIPGAPFVVKQKDDPWTMGTVGFWKKFWKSHPSIHRGD